MVRAGNISICITSYFFSQEIIAIVNLKYNNKILNKTIFLDIGRIYGSKSQLAFEFKYLFLSFKNNPFLQKASTVTLKPILLYSLINELRRCFAPSSTFIANPT